MYIIYFHRKHALNMELKLNISKKGKIWNKLGYYLFDFHTDNTIQYIILHVNNLFFRLTL